MKKNLLASIKAKIRRPLRALAGRRLREAIRHAEIVRLNVGAGGTNYPEWFSIEEYVLDITKRQAWQNVLAGRRVRHVLAEHVFEHLRYDDSLQAFRNIAEFLEPGGVFRFAVPDGNHPSEYVRDLTRPGGTDPGSDDHKYFYTIRDIPSIEKHCGLRAAPLEYFTDDGVFVGNPIDFSNGYIARCSVNYRGRFTESESEMRRMLDTVPEHLRDQFRQRNISYMSLLVDWTKHA
jgi:predicted SAM-dependent methyltransferase